MHICRCRFVALTLSRHAHLTTKYVDKCAISRVGILNTTATATTTLTALKTMYDFREVLFVLFYNSRLILSCSSPLQNCGWFTEYIV